MSRLSRIPPPVAWVVSVGLAALATRCAPALQVVWFRSTPVAWVAAVAALGWIAWAMAEFRRFRTTILPERRPTSLLCRGPFCVSRNPLYLGMLVLAAVPWLARGQCGLLLAPVLFFAFANWVVVPREEAVLRGRFGEAYGEYRRRVRRWC